MSDQQYAYFVIAGAVFWFILLLLLCKVLDELEAIRGEREPKDAPLAPEHKP
jgi:hypothetical protein